MNKHETKIEPYGYVKNMHLIEKAYFDTRLQNATKLLLALFVRYADINGQLERSIAEIGRKSGISRQAVQNQVKKLMQAGYIKRTINPNSYGDNAFNTYTLIHDSSPFTYPATQLDCPPATKLDCLPATSKDCPGATKLDCPKKTLQKEKQKNTRIREDFLELVKEAIEAHSFQEIGNFAEEFITSQAKACWERWDGDNNFPHGNPISKFKGWIRKGLRDGSIKETSNTLKQSNALQNKQMASPTNPIQAWHKQIERIVGEDVFKSWFRECWHDGNGKLCVPKKIHVQRIENEYSNEVAQVLPNVSIVHQPYKEGAHEKIL
ncbi:MAG: MarR family transcriptional regulator [Alphaproteobacteria bacterium]